VPHSPRSRIGAPAGSWIRAEAFDGASEEPMGAIFNEEEKVTVLYSSGAQGRTRRVRRTTRPPKEEQWRKHSAELQPAGYRRITAGCQYGSINLEEVAELMASSDSFRAFGERLSIVSYTEVVHCRFSSSSFAPESVCDAFIFPYGSVLLWGFSYVEELSILELLAPCSTPIHCWQPPRSSPTNVCDDLADFEFMLFTDATAETTEATRANSVITNNIITLKTDDATERLAISFAFAQSAKLSVLEAGLDSTTDEIRDIPEELARKGRCRVSANALARLTGRVYLDRNEVNLYSNILDSPDFFWEAETFEPLYRKVNRYLDIENRVSILNSRLDIVNDLLEGLSGQLEIRNSHRLEIIVIALIAIEILLELLPHGTVMSAGSRIFQKLALLVAVPLR